MVFTLVQGYDRAGDRSSETSPGRINDRRGHGIARDSPMKRCATIVFGLAAVFGVADAFAGLERVRYNHPGLHVDLAVGLWAWPLPMDYDGDGDLDLLVSCPDKPYNGMYFFENP